MSSEIKKYDFEIALSFAGENREYVREVANILNAYGVKIFYDEFEEHTLWGKNLIGYLQDIYKEKAKYTVMFISEYYAKKVWTNHERQSMQERAFKESEEYILPARFDDTEIPGLYSTISYIDLNTKSPYEFVKIILKKINWQTKNRWFGKWEIESSFLSYGGTLNIVNVYDNFFDFTITVFNGAHSGFIEGKSRILSNNEAEYICEDDGFDDEKCVIKFTKFNDVVQVNENFGCRYFHGMNVTFDGNYRLKRDVFYDYIELDDKLLSKIFNELKDEYFKDFLKCIGNIHNEDNIDSFRCNVISTGVTGLYTICESILMYTENDVYGAFLHDDEKIYYFTSDDNFRKEKPKTIIKWLSGFSKEIFELNLNR
ncbi:toll/interleukin-1 receptor domain-containing protein [Aliarcobacter butzleri]|uniref:toll/interleukin-1 receptor domain-containing protein n=1 Tax=Aliarcobacter butzleri TaxID=28197 RepID=UPI001260D028|nr:TIR domain-containing protein [Aliarcobacter butzleri]